MTFKPPALISLASFLFGLLYLALTPPFQVPDEVNHFYRACHIASGNFSAERHDNRLGGHLPEHIANAPSAFQYMRGNPFTRTNYRVLGGEIGKNEPTGQSRFMDFPNMALYTPVSYLPQALVAKICLAAGLSPVAMLYAIRLGVLCLWSLALFFSIRALPAFEWQLGLIALLPMTVFVNMSASADAITNMLGFLWIGSVVRYAFGERKMSARAIAGLLLLAGLIASAKYVYTPLVLLIFAIPGRQFPAGRRWPVALGLVVFAFGVAFLCSSYASSMYIPHREYNPAFVRYVDVPEGADINGQIKYLKSKPLHVPEVIGNSFHASRIMLVHTYIGVFGWLDARLPWFWVHWGYLMIAGLFFLKNPGLQFSIRQRALFISIAIGVAALIYLSQYLSWTPVGNPYCGSIQGRYFITVFPLLLIGLAPSGNNRSRLLPYILLAGFIVLLVAGSAKLYGRYFSIPPRPVEAMYCDAEEIWEDEYLGARFFRTNIPGQMASNGLAHSSDMARSGSHSCRVIPGHRYGFTYILYDFDALDTIHAEVWYKGKNAHLWLANTGMDFYLAQSVPAATDSMGWSKLEIAHPIGSIRPVQGFGIFVSSSDTCYFDDLKVWVGE